MANFDQRRSENIDGNFFVDDSCIDCGMCYWMAPSVFREVGDMSAVIHQPESRDEAFSACQALVSCPTSSIGTRQTPPEVKEAIHSFPFPIHENVYHCGFHSRLSYGAASYIIQRKAGNILVDSPRFVTSLVKRIEEMGGVRYLFLTHKDDVADHKLFQKHFGCKRIITKADLEPAMGNIETVLDIAEPYQLASDLAIIPVPGHTKGHSVLLYGDKILFTGDHLAWSADLKHLYAFKDACWYSWNKQIESMKLLSGYSFEWVLPGHGRRFHSDPRQMKEQMDICIQWMQTRI